MDSEQIRLNSSKLGTQQYWDEFYKREIDNFEKNPQDTGECWFDDSGAETKVVNYIVSKLNNRNDDYSHAPNNIDIVDLGTGNGHLLFELSHELEGETNVKFTFTGIDYSPDSIKFARDIADHHKASSSSFHFQQVDLLNASDPFILEHSSKFDILLDKGTLDAIALNTEELDAFEGKIGQDVYADQIVRLMHAKLLLLITLCNFTESELTRIITASGKLKVDGTIRYPTFKFGGANGSTICSVGFRKA